MYGYNNKIGIINYDTSYFTYQLFILDVSWKCILFISTEIVKYKSKYY